MSIKQIQLRWLRSDQSRQNPQLSAAASHGGTILVSTPPTHRRSPHKGRKLTNAAQTPHLPTPCYWPIARKVDFGLAFLRQAFTRRRDIKGFLLPPLVTTTQHLQAQITTKYQRHFTLKHQPPPLHNHHHEGRMRMLRREDLYVQLTPRHSEYSSVIPPSKQNITTSHHDVFGSSITNTSQRQLRFKLHLQVNYPTIL